MLCFPVAKALGPLRDFDYGEAALTLGKPRFMA
jgi:hypothetical protein